jgi:hypothetical protein
VSDRSLGLVDVHPSPVTQAACCRIIFFVIQIVSRLAQHILRTSEALRREPMRINARLRIRVLPVFPGSAPDFLNRAIDLAYRPIVILRNAPPLGPRLEQRTSISQVRESMIVSGMAARNLSPQTRRKRQK